MSELETPYWTGIAMNIKGTWYTPVYAYDQDQPFCLCTDPQAASDIVVALIEQHMNRKPVEEPC